MTLLASSLIMETPLPIEFAELAGKVNYVQRKTAGEYSSSCPFCGGQPHDGELPDRFIMWISSNATGKPLGYCRKCGRKWWSGSNDVKKMTDAERAEFERIRVMAERERESEKQAKLEQFKKSRVWEQYAKNLNEMAMNLYAQRGITEYFVYHWGLGFCYNRKYQIGSEILYSPSLTIPIIRPITKEVVNVKHRLLNPNMPYKYSLEMSGLPVELFVADTDKELVGSVLLVEGEFKAMTTYITLDNPNINVVGMPSSTPDLDSLAILANCEPVYIILDPDAFFSRNGTNPLKRLTDYFKGRCRVVRLPGKVDDLIMKHGLTKDKLVNVIKSAKST